MVAAEVPEASEHREFWCAVEAGYRLLRQDADGWAEYVRERDEWVRASLTGPVVPPDRAA